VKNAEGRASKIRKVNKNIRVSKSDAEGRTYKPEILKCLGVKGENALKYSVNWMAACVQIPKKFSFKNYYKVKLNVKMPNNIQN